MHTATKLTIGAGIATAAAAAWWRTHPSACPYGQRFWVQAPHPFISRTRLLEILAPSPGERILEVGPGTGYYTLPVADRLGPDGQVDVFDLQREMLDHTLRAASRRGLANIVATQGDAQQLPYPEASFDGAYLTTVLGEIPNQQAALSELRRVLTPEGRLVVGELIGDPHFVSARALGRRANAVGLRVTGRSGPRIGYFARLARA